MSTRPQQPPASRSGQTPARGSRSSAGRRRRHARRLATTAGYALIRGAAGASRSSRHLLDHPSLNRAPSPANC